MLGLAELAVAALVLLVAALVLRLRQHEPAAVERLGRRLDEARTELAAAEAHAAALREELAAGDAVLGPLRAERAELEADLVQRRDAAERAEQELGRVRTELAQERAALEAAGQELAAQRAQRAEVEAALRDARPLLAERPGAAAATGPSHDRAAGRPAGRAPVDLVALLPPDGPGPTEPAIVTTSGAVRPVGALPTDEPPTGGPGDAGEEQSS
jgi:septal ring factor EnvC (AmiA/AmiB activator)